MGGSRTSQFSLRNLRTIPAPDSVYGGRTIQSQSQQRSGRLRARLASGISASVDCASVGASVLRSISGFGF